MQTNERPNRRWPWMRHAMAVLALGTLAACGGGGGSGDAANPVGADPSSPVASAPTGGSGSGAGTGTGSGTGTGTGSGSGGGTGTGAGDGSSPPTLRTLSFTATNAEFPNPERGFYRWAWTNLDGLTAADAQDAYSNGYRLVYAPLNLANWRTSDLPASLLSQLTTAFANARSAGIKLVIRAVYNYPQSETEYQNAQDATLARVQGHLSQLKPVLQANADVIAYVQAGFIGAWGEWHTSSNQLTTAANRTAVRDALLAAVPSTRFIDVRYPPYVMAWTPTLPSLASVLSGSYRIGVHNDCFLASATDVGTYDENSSTQATQRDYVARLGDLAPFGGETCNPADEAGAVARTSCADILAEGAKYRLTYLNDDYYRDIFHAKWIQSGCMAEVKRKMGYRVQLVSASHATAVTRGQALALNLTVRNTGWARLFNPRGVQVLLRDASGTVRKLTATGADPRSWMPGADQTAAVSVTIPSDLPVGSYTLWLALPDGDSALASDVRYAVRWANADDAASGQKWDAALGAFALGSSVEVK